MHSNKTKRQALAIFQTKKFKQIIMTKLQKARKIKEKLENRLNTNKFKSTTAKRLFNLNEKLLELEFEKYINNQQKKHV
jgi:hypothetical protein